MEIIREPENIYELVKIPNLTYTNVKIGSSSDMYKYILPKFKGSLEIFESMFIIALNRAGMTIGHMKISQGGITGTVGDTRLICKYALDMLATAIILVHNHPSGNLKPSSEDVKLTAKISKALDTLDITLLDHLIVTNKKYYSFKDEGIL